MKAKRLIKMGILLGFFAVACSGNAVAKENTKENESANARLGEEVSVQTVASLKGKEGVIVLDVREKFEYAAEHIPGVKIIPLGQMLKRSSEYLSYKTVLVTCRSGNRSGQITRLLRSQGHHNVHNMTGGIIAWKKAGLSVVK